MFYVKADVANGVSIKAEINSENVFNLCPICGKECPADLADAVTEDGLDLYHTAICCDGCRIDLETK